MEARPGERLRAVLLHELRSIKGWDFLPQSAAFAVYSLFRFIPFVWTAYSHLSRERRRPATPAASSAGWQ